MRLPDDHPSQIRVPVQSNEAFCEHLRTRTKADDQSESVLVDPYGVGHNTDMNLEDPGGNLLIIWDLLEY
jgi:hypothetical protein